MFSFLFQEPDGCAKTLLIAEKAKSYARSIILKGHTQIENNALTPEYFNHLRKGTKGEEFAGMEGLGTSDIATEEALRRSRNGESDILAVYNSKLGVSYKFSLGDCDDLALHALDYIVRHVPEMEAELYRIKGGDHVFLVLNRDPDSAVDDTSKWGANAVICDPWANEVYPAKDALTRLRNFYFNEKEMKNCTEPYDPDHHFLMPYRDFNTRTLRQEIKREEIRQKNKSSRSI